MRSVKPSFPLNARFANKRANQPGFLTFYSGRSFMIRQRVNSTALKRLRLSYSTRVLNVGNYLRAIAGTAFTMKIWLIPIACLIR
ncbi:hypothetical protein D3C75_1277010 [compost metagenome]